MPNVSQENCTRCNGSGVYRGTRRDGTTYEGACFNCQGGGYPRRPYYGRRSAAPAYAAAVAATNLVNPVAPDMNGANGAPAIVAPAVSRNARVDAFEAAMPREYAWLVSGQGGDFAASLLRGIARYGNLTPRQLACVQRNLPAAAAPALDANLNPAALRAAYDAAIPAAPTIGFDQASVDAAQAEVDRLNATAIATRPAPVASPRVTVAAAEMRNALLTARNNGLRRPRLTLGLYEFRLGRVGTPRADTVFVYIRPAIRSSAWSYVGSIGADDNFNRSYSAPATVDMELVRDACSNPRNAAAAHGHDTTYCSCCRRLLTDPPSVMAGIGPVCITRFGWL